MSTRPRSSASATAYGCGGQKFCWGNFSPISEIELNCRRDVAKANRQKNTSRLQPQATGNKAPSFCHPLFCRSASGGFRGWQHDENGRLRSPVTLSFQIYFLSGSPFSNQP